MLDTLGFQQVEPVRDLVANRNKVVLKNKNSLHYVMKQIEEQNEMRMMSDEQRIRMIMNKDKVPEQ